MSLATRCTVCGTAFRVVQDQLKVSEGWVRCGRCNEVFSALESLFDLDQDMPQDGSPAVPPAPAASSRAGGTDASSSSMVEVTAAAGPSVGSLPATRDSEDGATPAARVNERDRREFPDAQFAPESTMDDATRPDPAAPALRAEAASEPKGQSVAPEFMRRAERQARWQSPRSRAGMVAGVALLLAALALQGMHHFRDLMAARWPAASPGLVAWCIALSCSIEAPRRIDDVAVETSALTRASAPDAFKLSVTLRNRGTMIVALPAMDLNLTDPGGQLIARRVLAPRDFGAASATIQPGAESALQLVLTASGTQFSGYTVEIFYP